jgi:hypothetical protein
MSEKARTDELPILGKSRHESDWAILSDARYRRLVTWIAVGCISVRLAASDLWVTKPFGRSLLPKIGFLKLLKEHYATLLGTPAATATASFVYCFTKVTSAGHRLFPKHCHIYELFCGRRDRIETALKTSDTVH